MVRARVMILTAFVATLGTVAIDAAPLGGSAATPDSAWEKLLSILTGKGSLTLEDVVNVGAKLAAGQPLTLTETSDLLEAAKTVVDVISAVTVDSSGKSVLPSDIAAGLTAVSGVVNALTQVTGTVDSIAMRLNIPPDSLLVLMNEIATTISRGITSDDLTAVGDLIGIIGGAASGAVSLDSAGVPLTRWEAENRTRFERIGSLVESIVSSINRRTMKAISPAT